VAAKHELLRLAALAGAPDSAGAGGPARVVADAPDSAGAGGPARVVADPTARLPGRGAYVCNAACAEIALRRRALPRAFRRAVTTAPDFVESIG
jgi:predicted RNA-binding protein YlxR (DUF448 family)